MSRYTANKQSQKRQEEKVRALFFVPIILLLAVVPLIVRLKITEKLTQNVRATYKIQSAVDFFSYYKVMWIFMITIGILFIVFFTLTKQKMKRYKDMTIYIGASGVFLFFTMLSALFSPYKKESILGVPDRMEGLLIMVCYIIMMLYMIYIFTNIKDYKYIVWALSVLIIVLTFLGIFEYMGKNLLLNTELGKSILVPTQYAQYRNSLGVSYDKGKVYGTMFHYNYMGSFGALMVPLFATLALYIKGRKEKLYCMLLTIAAMFLLFGSTSRGGLIGLVLAVFIGTIIFSQQMLKKCKIVVPSVLACATILILFNSLTRGTIFERIPGLIQDVKIGLTSSEETFNYLDEIPIRDITMRDGKTTIITQADQITMAIEGSRLALYDQAGKEIPYLETDTALVVQDTRFEGFALKKAFDEKRNWVGSMLNINGLDTMVFKMDTVQGIYLIDHTTQQKIELDFPETFGFKGKERLGSARGYIWSRSIPMLKDTLLIGHGPDTFAFEFPQQDYLGKYYAYETPNMVVDKPHNLYLQIGINQGVIALIAFLVLVVVYMVESIKLYALRENYENKQIIGVATMLGIVGYLGAGLFNDSVVSVAPVFWILLGAGIAINTLNKQAGI